jgi:transcriptional regulator with XRE-family HTH domain
MSTATATPISEQLRAEIRSAGSIRSLAIRSGIDRASLLRYRRGEQSPSIDKAERLAEALGFTLVLEARS